MADQVQLRGGTSAEHASFTGAVREVTVDTTKKTAVVHDGATPGGAPLLREDLANLPANTIPAEKLEANVLDPQAFRKADYYSAAFTKTGAQTLSLKAGTTIMVDSVLFHYATDTAVTMPALSGGSDYAVFANPDGTLEAVADPYNAPASPPQTGSRKIGGFHYGLVAPGTTPAGGSFATSGFTNTGGPMVWTQGDVDKIAGINQFTLWDLCFRCAGDQHGMALDPQTGAWLSIYFCSVDHITNGVSKYNSDVASGTVLPRIPLVFGGNGSNNYGRFSWYEANEIALSHGLRLPTFEEFTSAAFGVTEGQSLGGSSVTISATARQAGYTSRIGLEQATGHQNTVGAPLSSSGGTAYQTDPGRGSFYGTTGFPLYGGDRGLTSDSGSRCASFINTPWVSAWNVSLRAAGDLKIAFGIG
jgi:hypothetical protein